MPGDDLLRFLGGPLPLSWWWPVIAALLVTAVLAWCAGVLVWTMSPERLRAIPVLRRLHAVVIRRRFLHSLYAITARFQDRELTPAQTSAAYDRALRSFLFLRTGIRAQYLHLQDLAADASLTRVVPLLAALDDAKFNSQTRSDITTLGRSAEQLVRTWN
jgi:hypothetical protein